MAAYDQLFKDLLRAFFRDFLALFLPRIAAGLDPAAAIDFLNNEVFTDVPAGLMRRADLVAQIRGRGGEPETVLLHIETQAQPDPTLPDRLWAYNVMLRLREDRPVISIAFLPFAREGTDPVRFVTYSETLYGQEYPRLAYWQIALRDAAAEPYVEAEEALGAGLAALMTPEGDDRLALKRKIARRLLTLMRDGRVDKAQLRLLINLMETVLTPRKRERQREAEAEEEITMGMLEEMEIVDDIELTWAEELLAEGREQGEALGREQGREQGEALGREQGREQGEALGREQGETLGLERGVLEARREDIVRILEMRFGSVPIDIRNVLAGNDKLALDRSFEAALRAATLDEFGAALPRP